MGITNINREELVKKFNSAKEAYLEHDKLIKSEFASYPVGWDVKIRALNVATRLANIKFFQKPDARMDEIPTCLRFGHANAIRHFYAVYMNKFCNRQTGGER